MSHQKPQEFIGIEGFRQKERSYYLVAVAAMARADGNLRKRDMEFLEHKVVQFKLTRHYRDRVIHTARNGKPNLRGHFKWIRNTPLRYSLMLDMMAMAMVDGIIMDSERDLLREAAHYMGIPGRYFDLLMEFFQAVHSGQECSSPEPMYEYAIESMFNYFRENQIPLLENPTFTLTSDGYNRQLQARLGS